MLSASGQVENLSYGRTTTNTGNSMNYFTIRRGIIRRGIIFAAVAVATLGCRASYAQEFDWQRFEVAGRPAFTILPKLENRREPMPWVLYAPTFGTGLPNERDEGWMISHFLEHGIAIAGVDVGESYGSPKGRDIYSALHAQLVESTPKFSSKACLLARSRGGLMLYSWAADNPDKVACIAGIYPVCDLRSYPGLANASGAFGLTEKELAEQLGKHNPVQRLAGLAEAKIPILHIHGDVDSTVPLESNSAAVAKQYDQLGGKMELIVATGQGHNMWRGFFECDDLVDFVIYHATGKLRTSREVPKPIAHWRLDEKTTDTATDSVGDHHGKIIGATRVPGKLGQALSFEREKGQHVAIEYSKDFELDTFTVSAWVKLTRPPTFSGILGTRFGSECTFDMKVNDAKVHGDIGDGKTWIETKVNFYADDTGTTDQGGDLEIGPWYHIVYVIDGGKQQCRLYLDADLKKRIPYRGKALLMQDGQEMRIGHSSSDEYMDGVIDDVQIWSSALSAAQVRTLHRSASGDQE